MLDRPPAVEGAVWRAVECEGRKQAVVDLPPMGFAWLTAGPENVPAPASKRRSKKPEKSEPPLAEPYVLRNEYLEADFDPITGAIKSISDYVSRGNRLAQQIGFRAPRKQGRGALDEDFERDYSVMAADELSVSCGPLVGRIVSRGRLLDRGGRRLAGFCQTTTVRRGSRVLEIDIELDVREQPGSDPWTSYYAARFAWGDATAEVYRGAGMLSLPTEAVLLEAPQFIDIRSEKHQTTLLTGGLPYHRRFGLRKLDTLLVVRGETARRFRIGIGIDLAYAVPAALDFLSPECLVLRQSPPRTASGWLCHIDARNVVATHWEPWVCEGELLGFRVRLLETEGRPARIGLRSFRPIQSARKLNLRGGEPAALPVDDDRVTVEAKAHQWLQIEARFKD
jgi:alpha-mannosidase